MEKAFTCAAIDKRHSVIDDPDTFFVQDKCGSYLSPGTAFRNDLFIRHAPQISARLTSDILLDLHYLSPDLITDIIFVTCTGFSNPGPEFEAIRLAGLPPNIRRYNLGFMGCYAAIPAIRFASTICNADPCAMVLVLDVELCTLHSQLKTDTDSLLAAALFADGGAAVIVSSERPCDRPSLRCDSFETLLIPDSLSEMAWHIGDTGFDMLLSQYVPRLIQSNIVSAVESVLASHKLGMQDIAHWAIHPGGRAILDRIESVLDIEHRLNIPRNILRRYGNMSSTTILFVLKEIMSKASQSSSQAVFATAFGPGLTMESALMTYLPAPVQFVRIKNKHAQPVKENEKNIYN